MNASTYINNELRKLEAMARQALEKIQASRTIAEVISGMRVPVPAHLHCLRASAPSLSRIERTAFSKAEAIVRAQLLTLAQLQDDSAKQRQRERLMNEWRQLHGHFPRLGAFIQAELAGTHAGLRLPISISQAPAASFPV